MWSKLPKQNVPSEGVAYEIWSQISSQFKGVAIPEQENICDLFVVNGDDNFACEVLYLDKTMV